MAKPQLYHSSVPIPSARRTAAQINPGVARTTGGQGLRQVGEAMFSVGLQMHQVNIARQVADAMAQYKEAEANFMFKMMNADPSKTNYDQAWGEFVSGQGDLTAGVSRDAGNIINNKIKLMQASDYKSFKRMEIVNTRALVMNELPGVMDSLMREQVKAEMDGDFARAEQAKQNMVEYMQGVGPTMRPGEGAKLIRMYDAGLDKARTEEEAQRFAGLVLKDPVAAEASIDGLKYQTNEQKLSLRTMARRQQGVQTRESIVQKNAMLDQQSGVLLQQLFEGSTLMLPEGVAPELQSTVDAANNNTSIINGVRGELPPEYYDFKNKINSMTPIDDRALFYASPMIPPEALQELDRANKETIKLLPRKEEAKLINKHINDMFEKLIITSLTTQWDETDTSTILMRELTEEKEIVLKDIRKRLLDGDSRIEIMTDLNNLFKATREGVLENRFMRKWKTGTNEFYASLEKSDDPQIRLHALMKLLMDGKWSDQIEDAVQAGWIDD